VVGPSGEQFEIAFGDQRAVVTEVGGGLRTYSVGDRQLVDGYDADQMCASGRGQVLIPWPNRIGRGNYQFRGREHQLPINEHVTHSAIHGLVRWVAWDVAEREEHRVVVVHDLYPQPGYPFALALRIEYALSDQGLGVSTSATNVGVARVTLASPGRGTRLSLWADESYSYLMLYTGDDRPDVSRRSLAVEPMTCPPQAFRSGEDVITLEPGDSVAAGWGMSPA
jgi:galactose mutarotase-like enzyme